MNKINYKAKAFFMSLLLLCSVCHGQIHSVDSILFLSGSEVSNVISKQDSRAALNENVLAILYKVNDSLQMSFIDCSKQLFLSGFSFHIPATELASIKEIAYSKRNNIIALLSFDSLKIFSSLDGSPIKKMAMKHMNYIHFTNEHIFVACYYNYHPNDREKQLSIYRLNYELVAQDSLFIEPDFIEYTHYLPRQLISFNEKNIAVTLLGQYGILWYDTDFNFIDTVMFPKENWVQPPKELNKSVKKYPDRLNNYFSLIDEQNYKTISRIEYLQFTNDSTLFVRWYKFDSSAQHIMRHIDVVTKHSDGHFALLKSYQETPFPPDAISPISRVGFPLFSENTYAFYFDSGVIQIRPEYYPLSLSEINYLEYYENKQKRALSEEPSLSIWFFNKENK